MVVRLGRKYRSIIVTGKQNEKMTVAFVDSGADETVISKNLANEIGVDLYGIYRSYSITGQAIEGRFAQVTLKDKEIEIITQQFICPYCKSSVHNQEEKRRIILF